MSWMRLLVFVSIVSLLSSFAVAAADSGANGGSGFQWGLGHSPSVKSGSEGPVEVIRIAQAADSGSGMNTRASSRESANKKKKKPAEDPGRKQPPKSATGSETAPQVAPSAIQAPGPEASLPDPVNPGLKSPKEPSAGPTAGVQGSPGKPNLVDPKQIQALVMPADTLKSVGNYPTGPEGKFSHLELEVSHSQHTLKLQGKSSYGKKEVLYQCGVGLGSPEFPTPTGVYFVTHIYDEDPWWIPPPNRAWAAGQSPSRRIYGGTMAPLLKKRPVREKKQVAKTEDLIEKKFKLDDYGYRFHGTNAPRSIGRNQSHGCVRMVPDDARKVAEIIKGYVGISKREESENGTYVVLRAPVRLNLVK